MKQLVVLFALVLLAAPAAWADPPPGEYTYTEALRLGLVSADQFARVPGEPLCGPLPDPIPSVGPGGPPDNAPSCWRPPEEQGIVVLDLGPGDPGFGNFFAGDNASPPPFGALAALGVDLNSGS